MSDPQAPLSPLPEAIERVRKRVAEIGAHLTKYPNSGLDPAAHAADLIAILAALEQAQRERDRLNNLWEIEKTANGHAWARVHEERSGRQSAEASLAEAVGALEPFGHAKEVIDDGLSVSITRADGLVLVSDSDFLHAAEVHARLKQKEAGK